MVNEGLSSSEDDVAIRVREARQPSHPKARALFEYLIRTYTDPGELVLDNCIGSGTTAIACINADADTSALKWNWVLQSR